MNLGGFPTYASLSSATRPTRRLAAKYPSEESEIMLVTTACQDPKFTPDNTNTSGGTGAPFPLTFNTNGTMPADFQCKLPTPRFIYRSQAPEPSPAYRLALERSRSRSPQQTGVAVGTGILNLTIDGGESPDSTPWPVNLARKGTVAFADLTALPSIPTAVTPTTPVGT